MKRNGRKSAFTLIELLVVIAIISLLVSILLPSLSRAKEIAKRVICASNIRHLAISNSLYAGENGGFFVLAAQDIFDDLGDGRGGHFRWQGSRDAANEPFDPAKGPLKPYLGPEGKLRWCPTFVEIVGSAGGSNFEWGNGGYGYNAQYIGGRNDKYGFSEQAAAESANAADVTFEAATVMFTDAGIAQTGSDGSAIVTEYSFCEPYFWQLFPGPPSAYRPSPSIHFRHVGGTANVAWADGHADWQLLEFSNISYGLTAAEVQDVGVGWFAPDNNSLFDLQ